MSPSPGVHRKTERRCVHEGLSPVEVPHQQRTPTVRRKQQLVIRQGAQRAMQAMRGQFGGGQGGRDGESGFPRPDSYCAIRIAI